MSEQIDIAKLTHEDVERWLEAERWRLGLKSLGINAYKWRKIPVYDVHLENACDISLSYESVLRFVASYDPEFAKKKRISELESELARLKGGEA